jgi:hypothetical protein
MEEKLKEIEKLAYKVLHLYKSDGYLTDNAEEDEFFAGYGCGAESVAEDIIKILNNKIEE